MSDLIELKLVTEDEAECLHRLQLEAFMPLYEKYQDDDTSPAKVFFASTFWKKLQSIFGECCISKLEKVAKPRLAAILPAT